MSTVAMTVTLLSFAMLFATLILGYSLLRLNSPAWPPMGMNQVDLFYPTLSSILIALSSLSYHRYETTTPSTSFWLAATWFLGLGFLTSQWLLWQSLENMGLYASTGIFPSLIYGLTWIHGGHLALGLALLTLLWFKRKRFQDPQTESLWKRNIGKFWHFLGGIWFVLYLWVFVF